MLVLDYLLLYRIYKRKYSDNALDDFKYQRKFSTKSECTYENQAFNPDEIRSDEFYESSFGEQTTTRIISFKPYKTEEWVTLYDSNFVEM